ncbi:MAG: hypothetical protein LRY40_03865 [Shewanella fodinae]|nr:hypothetical protein [Shewanella fodinae]
MPIFTVFTTYSSGSMATAVTSSSSWDNWVEVMVRNYIERSAALKQVDRQREADHNWFLHQRWVGMALYANGFAKNLSDLCDKVDYFASSASIWCTFCQFVNAHWGKRWNGGYAVSNFRQSGFAHGYQCPIATDNRWSASAILLDCVGYCG